MEIIELSDTIDSLVFEASPPRSPGLHLSDILHSLCADLDPKRFNRVGALPWNKFESGFTFERVMEMAFASRREGGDIFRPGEQHEDGIAMSPDGIDPDGSTFSFSMDEPTWILDETKFTWMSSFDAPHHQKFIHYFWQMKAYARALGTLRARLRVLFVNGDYRHGFQPDYKAWDIQFTQEELDQNWAMILHHARSKGML